MEFITVAGFETVLTIKDGDFTFGSGRLMVCVCRWKSGTHIARCYVRNPAKTKYMILPLKNVLLS